MWQPHAEYRALGQTSHSRQLAYRNLFENQMASNLITDIRQAITQDWYSETTGSGKKLNSLPAKGNATSIVDQSPNPNLRRSFHSDPKYSTRVGNVAGFSLHARVATKANERAKLERLCRYIARPAVSTKRLSMTRNGRVRYELKTPWRNGTTHVIFEPLDFMYRMYGMPRAQGCAGAAMYRMYGMPRAHDCRDAGGRATQEQLPRDAQERPCTGCTVCRGRTTAGMQEVGQRRSSCRGMRRSGHVQDVRYAAGARLQGCRR